MINATKVKFAEFFQVLKSYREKFYSTNPEENYYLIIFKKIVNLEIQRKKDYIKDILLFLNQWKCHIYPKELFIEFLGEWINKNITCLNELASYSIFNINESKISDIDRLYSSLINFKENGIPTMGDAASSKILHLVIPGLFVMWDKNIKSSRSTLYSQYILKMHDFASSIRSDFLTLNSKIEIEDYLMTNLRYDIKKPFSKYIDEYNWYKAFGVNR